MIRDAVWVEVKQHFRPEFLNRIDETVVFHALDAKNIEAIAQDPAARCCEARLEKMDMKLDVSPAALAELAKVGFDPVFGARPLKRAIQQRIENPVSKLILEGRFGPKDTIVVTTDPIRTPGQFSFRKAGEHCGGGRGLTPMLNFILRFVLFLLGLVFAASLAVAVLLLAAVWGLRYGWARLTGQPVRPWVMRFDPRGGFERFRAAGRPARADGSRRGRCPCAW